MEIVIDGSLMVNKVQAHDHLSRVFDFPKYYGNNLDALYDMLTGYIDHPITVRFINSHLSHQHLKDYHEELVSIFNEVDGISLILEE